MSHFDHSMYISPFTWRYGSSQMRTVFSELHKYQIWRSIWVALAKAQHTTGLVSKEELQDLEKHKDDIDIEEILRIEQETKHDVVAAIKEFAGKAKTGGGKIHLGATSMDIVDNAEVVRTKEALGVIEKKLKQILLEFAGKIKTYHALPCMAYTHLQPAEPTTVGYRMSFYAQDLLSDFELLQFVKKTLKGKGMKGAVGTAASYQSLLHNTNMSSQEMEEKIMKELGIEASLISTQVYSRKFDYFVLTVLNSIASSLAKFAADVRILQSPPIGEWSEPFGKKQVGSSAMPFKRNPVNAEKICSLARYIASLPSIALENATLSYLERTLDDSANRRIFLPEAFLAADEILETAQKILSGLVVNMQRIAYNFAQYAPFAATEQILMETVKQGANRQDMHEVLRTVSLSAWSAIQEGKQNPMEQYILENPEINAYLSKKQIQELLDPKQHVGTAPERSLTLANHITNAIK